MDSSSNQFHDNDTSIKIKTLANPKLYFEKMKCLLQLHIFHVFVRVENYKLNRIIEFLCKKKNQNKT